MIDFGKHRTLLRQPGFARTTGRAMLGKDAIELSWMQKLADLWAAFPLKEILLTLALLSVVMLSALGVVYSSHISRELFAEQAVLLERNDQLQLEWAQLLLEQSAFTSPGQVENVAARELQMVLPKVQEVELVK